MKKQSKPAHGRIVLTESDLDKVKSLVGTARKYLSNRRYLELLDQRLDEADVVSPERVPRDVVEIDTSVRITDLDRSEKRVYRLVLPRDANYDDRISVVAPLGSALLGSRVGEVVEVYAPARTRRIRVDAIARRDERAA